ncbi:PorP/SprF family type IX secretion system membrane protein [Mucilaginibacter sp. HMF5004]|uniref:PorP/SprF family type IX secretion system membrane protein n=1 Tax=Mucilaginibacter rivuli TaxID=2857527 RepID=UPI001C5E5C27|nr:PorP/SprF family type IX secretion system membrane protein [Mucilaginibacter rivuli]MBW4891667.1 PorP/SprF family type IX secretion system membrane protein [Mucilaginibacter rivuli]
MRKCFIITMVACCICVIAKAQDPTFSQYYASPLSYNPANTGFFDGDMRVGLNERQQWWNVGYNYNSTSVFIDTKLMKDRIDEYDVFSIGLSGVFERSVAGALHSNYLSFSTAYHKSLDYQGAQTLGLGVQFNYTDKYLDYSQLSFASQFNGKGFDLSMPGSTFGNAGGKSQYFDLNAGLLYAAHFDKANFYAGASLYHITKPNETVYYADGAIVPMRMVLHGGGEFIFNDVSSVLFSGYYNQQADATDAIYGAAYGLKLYPNNEILGLYVGLWQRLHNSFIPYIGADYRKISIGLDYGIPSSTSFGFSPQTFEVSVIYKLGSNSSKAPICPRF